MPLEAEQVDSGDVGALDPIPASAAHRESTPESPPMIESGRRDRETERVTREHRLGEQQYRGPGQLTPRIAAISGVQTPQDTEIFVDEGSTAATEEPGEPEEKIVDRASSRLGLKESGHLP